jgi:phytoene dehydrogenase-like protein
MNPARVVVIGGGVSGLATACLLARDGHRVTLLERSTALGGRAGAWEQDGFVFDTGPSWYLMPEVFDHFYRMMGTTTAEQLGLVPLEPGYRVYAQASGSGSAGVEPVDVGAGSDRVAALFESREHGSAERVRRYLASATKTYRAAVAAAHGLFSRLAERCRETPAEQLIATRIRVPDGEKLAIAVRSALTTGGNRR